MSISLASRHRSSASTEKLTCANMKSAAIFQRGSGRSPAATPIRHAGAPAKAGSVPQPRAVSIIERTFSSLVRPPEVGLSP
jgi:hypothetical protein